MEGMNKVPNRLFTFEEEGRVGAKIKVVGVGGGGCNAVNRMIQARVEGIEFISANTDLQALERSMAPIKLQLGGKLTKGLGAGANPDVGRAAALEDTERIIEQLEGADMVFITAGLGGGTGTGAAPIIASLSSELGALTIAVVTKPFTFEGRRRSSQAEMGLKDLKDCVDTVITIPNDRLLQALDLKTPLMQAFNVCDDVLRQAVQGISDLITVPGMINLDFADVRTIMQDMGIALMGIGVGEGDNRAADAARRAISNPLLEDCQIHGAKGVIMNVTGSDSMTMRMTSARRPPCCRTPRTPPPTSSGAWSTTRGWAIRSRSPSSPPASRPRRRRRPCRRPASRRPPPSASRSPNRRWSPSAWPT